MNNLLDDSRLYKNAFNKETKDRTWTSTKTKIKFSSKYTWEDYVKENVLEITCGEAPYLVSRYDTVTGEILDIKDRIGLLDRKLRVVNENVAKKDKNEWYKWSLEAFKHTYGFEWQGDSLLIARENLFYTFKDYYTDRFGIGPTIDELKEIAEIISWNIWQMDGLKGVIPYSCKEEKETEEITIFDYLEDEGAKKNKKKKKTINCKGCAEKDVIKGMKMHNKNGEKHIINEDSVFGDTVRRIPGDVGVFVYDKSNNNKKIVYQNEKIDRVEHILPVIKELIPLAIKLSKYAGTFEFSSIKKVCESNFVENNKRFVLNEDVDRTKDAPNGYTKVLTNNIGGSGGQAHWYYIKTDKLDRVFEKKYKLVLSSAYPNESFMNPDNVELLNDDEFFGRTKLAIYDDINMKKVQCCKKYLSTKFARIICLMTPYSFLYYLPNFNDIYNDIDWSKSIEDIDNQLYDKYDLSKEEIAFIEKNIKPMN